MNKPHGIEGAIAAAGVVVVFGLFSVGSASAAHAEQAPPQAEPSFDVASVVQVQANSSGMPRGLRLNPGYLRYRATLEDLIRYAYEIQGFESVVGGPSWLHDDGGTFFVVEARYSPNADENEVRGMLKTLLAKCFQVSVHSDTIEGNVYELRTGSKPAKFILNAEHGAPPACPQLYAEYKSPRLTLTGTVAEFAGLLSKYYRIDVLDKTAISGGYQFSFCYPMPSGPAIASGAELPDGLPAPPTIEQAVEDQLGLKLVSTPGRIRRWVVDHAELPDANAEISPVENRIRKRRIKAAMITPAIAPRAKLNATRTVPTPSVMNISFPRGRHANPVYATAAPAVLQTALRQ